MLNQNRPNSETDFQRIRELLADDVQKSVEELLCRTFLHQL